MKLGKLRVYYQHTERPGNLLWAQSLLNPYSAVWQNTGQQTGYEINNRKKQIEWQMYAALKMQPDEAECR